MAKTEPLCVIGQSCTGDWLGWLVWISWNACLGWATAQGARVLLEGLSNTGTKERIVFADPETYRGL